MTSRLVVVSNRIGDPRKAAAGGLAVALGDALSESGGLWFGWSGKVVAETAARGERRSAPAAGRGRSRSATLDLEQRRPRRPITPATSPTGCCGPCSTTGIDLARVRRRVRSKAISRVNRLFARKLSHAAEAGRRHLGARLPPDPAGGRAARRSAVSQRIGFFLHIPMPPPLVMAAIPGARVADAFAVRLRPDRTAERGRRGPLRTLRRASRPAPSRLEGKDHYRAFGQQVVRAGAFPIGIDVDEFQALAQIRRNRSRRVTTCCASQYAAAPAADRGRPARLLQGSAAASARLPSAAGRLPREPQQRDPDPGGHTDTRGRG